jgi:sugar/nucleoside kinase (ribokinase family)
MVEIRRLPELCNYNQLAMTLVSWQPNIIGYRTGFAFTHSQIYGRKCAEQTKQPQTIMRNKKPIDVVVAGHLCLDIIPRFANTRTDRVGDILTPGRLVNVGEVTTSTGGLVSNTGIALLKLGLKVDFIGKVGDDLFGKAIIGILRNYIEEPQGVITAKGEHSSYTIVIAIPGIDRIFLHNPGTNHTFGFNDINFDIVRNARLFHLGYPPLMRNLYVDGGDELIKILARVQSMGITTSLDMALPDPDSESGKVDWTSILKKLLPHVDIFTPSIEEIMFMIDKKRLSFLKREAKGGDIINFFKPDDLTRISDVLLGCGAKIIVLKCGHRGFYLRTAGRARLDKIGYAKPAGLHNWSNRELWAPCYHIDRIVNAIGSGDSAAAGFLAGYLKGESPEICMKCANAAGAQNVEAVDAVSGVKTWDEVMKTVRAPDAKLKDLEISEDNWVYDDVQKLWRGPGEK